LETCAGSNRNLRYFKPGVDLTLIDYSPNMMSIGSSKTSPFVKYRYVVGDVMAMPFPDDQFDCVIDTFGLEYTLNPHRALEEIRR
jgi:ubiquinone/menaquinone biosynthesis C-methylase UbiE